MEPVRFYTANLILAVLYAVSHVAFGVLLGAGLVLLNAVAGRLAVLAGILLILLYLVVWLSRWSVRRLPPCGGDSGTAATALGRYTSRASGQDASTSCSTQTDPRLSASVCWPRCSSPACGYSAAFCRTSSAGIPWFAQIRSCTTSSWP